MLMPKRREKRTAPTNVGAVALVRLCLFLLCYVRECHLLVLWFEDVDLEIV